MTPDQIESKVREVICRKLKVEPDKVRPETRLAEDLGVDSFGAVELMFELEEAFGLKIADSEIEHIRTVRDVVDYLTGWMAKQGAG
jgi:acyl carrier protein